MRLPRLDVSHVLLILAALAPVACAASTDEGTRGQSAAIEAKADAGAVEGRGSREAGTTESPATTTHLRVVAANLTSGNLQSYDPGDGARILQGLAPDVALMQEFNYASNSDADLRGFVDTTFGPEFSYARELGGQIPNGVVSRFPIVASGAWNDPATPSRDFSWARIDVPGDKDLWAISVHLLTSGSSNRQQEATALVASIRAQIPETDYVVLGGDFNTGSRTEACVRTLGAVLRTTGPFPLDNTGNGDTSGNRSEPHDWVLADHDLDALETPVVIGSLTFPAGLVFDSRVFRPLDTVAPVRTGDSGSSNMQHMAVVRDFVLPAVAAAAPAATR